MFFFAIFWFRKNVTMAPWNWQNIQPLKINGWFRWSLLFGDGPFSGANLPLVSGRVVVQARAAETFLSLELRSKQLKVQPSAAGTFDLSIVNSKRVSSGKTIPRWQNILERITARVTYWIGHGHWIRDWTACNWWQKSKKIKHRCSMFFQNPVVFTSCGPLHSQCSPSQIP